MPGLSSDLFVHGRGGVLAHVLGDGYYLHRQRSCAETDRDHIAHLHVVGCPLYPAVIVTLPASQASLATVRRLMSRETFRYLSKRMGSLL